MNNLCDPFSHKAGVSCLLPGTALEFQLFPTLIYIQDLSQAKPKLLTRHELNIQGPVKNFTVMQDLEDACIYVWGESQKGLFKYRISNQKQNPGWCLKVEKQPDEGLIFNPPIPSGSEKRPFNGEILSLGSFKKQDWTLIHRRFDMAEIFSFWMQLGQITPAKAYAGELQGTLALLHECHEAIMEHPPEKKLNPFIKLFLAGFHGIQTPRLIDEQHQGFSLPPLTSSDLSPLLILTEGAKYIRKLFVLQEGSQISVLTSLPPQFHSGRLLNVRTALGKMDIEWTKKSIRRMVAFTDQKGEWDLVFQKPYNRFRIRSSKQDRGTLKKIGSPLLLESNQEYYFDQFEK